MAVDQAEHRRGLALITVTAVLWGSIGIVVRLLQNGGMTSAPILFWRLVCGSLVLLPLIGRSGLRTLLPHLRRPRRLAAVTVSALAFQLLYFVAVRDVGAAVATLVTLGVSPVVLHLSDAVTARSAPPPRTLVVLAMALGGLALVTTGDHNALVAPRPVLGVVESLGSGLFYAASTSWSRPLSTRLTPFAITFATSLVGAVALVPVVAVAGWSLPRTVPTVSGILWLGVVTTVLAYGLFYTGLRSVTGSTAMIITLLEPVTAVVLAAALLDEPLTLANVLGGVLLLAAVVTLYARPPGRATPDPPPH